MRIHDEKNDKKLDRVGLFLTLDEARQMIDYLQGLIEDPSKLHAHVSSEDYQKEITFAIYNPENLESFNPRVKKLILEDS